MKEKKTRRWLSLLLTVVMVLSLLPAAVVPAAAASETDGLYKTVHLDCGRKYFSPEWIVALLHEMKNDGYNQLQLAFGNDGLRFLLDDMSFKANETTYSHEDVVSKIEAGNKAQNSSGDARWLTQSEMDEIIAIANDLGIEIVPLLNLPGHANAILDIVDDKYNASGSNNTLNVAESSDAREFGKAIFQKYVDYFKGKDCKFFNFGADEYANDVSGTPSFGKLNSTQYGNFVSFINDLAKTIENAGMTPRAFNDGLYYNNQYVTIDTNIQCCYWSSGWSGYDVASASTIANKGHKMINTNGDYYYILGKDDKFDSGYTYAANFSNTAFMGSTVNNPAGSMFCIWCDYPNAETETEVAQKVRLPLRAMALRMAGESINSMSTDVVTNGFNADGSINKDISGGNPGGSTGDGTLTEKTITVAVGKTVTETDTTGNYEDNYEDSKLDTDTATVTVAGTTTAGTEASWDMVSDLTKGTYIIGNKEVGQWLVLSGRNLSYTTDPDKATKWTVSTSGTNYTIKSGSYYLSRSNVSYYSATLSVSFSSADWSYDRSGFYFTHQYYGRYYLQFDKDNTKWQLGNERDVYRGAAYKYTAGTEGTASTKITFTGVAVGDTEVTVGNVHYTIHVYDPALTSETLTVEYWITNSRVTAGGATESTITATDKTVNSADGAKLSDLISTTGTRSDGTTAVFWKGTRLASDNMQTTGAGDDKTKAGNDFTYIRYYDKKWSYSADGKTWTPVKSDDQIVAYYLQRTTVTDEVISDVVDYGPEKNGWSGLNYLNDKYVLLDYTVKYMGGTETPSTFPNAKSIGFHCDPGTEKDGYYYRTLGMIRAAETKDYEVYLITVTPTNDSAKTTLASTAAGNTSYTYDGTETVAWAATQEDLDASGLKTYASISGAFGCTIGGEPIVSGLEIYRQQGMKVTYYVRAKASDAELYVHYVNKANNETFYEYTINVKGDTTFKKTIGLNSPWKDKLLDGNVVNTLDKEEWVTADLSKMLAIAPAYRYSDYKCDEVRRSADGKDVYLYYTFNNTHNIVIDFGLPVNIKPADIKIEGDWTGAKVTEKGKFGTAEIAVGGGLTYTPTKVLTGHDTLNLTLIDADNKESNQQIYIYPASNVLYEDNFLTVNTEKDKETYKAWDHTEGTYSRQSAKQEDLYGYDGAYDNSTGNSMGGYWTVTDLVKGKGSKYLTTTFNGTGFDLIGTAGPNTGYVYLALQGSQNKLLVIDTSYVDGKDTTLYQVPLAHLEGLTAGNYTVNIRAAYRAATSASSAASQAAVFSVQSAPANSLDDVYAAVDEMLADGMSIDDCEFVYMDPSSPLAQMNTAVYALADEASAQAATDSTADRPAGTTATIDGFRVYQDSKVTAYIPNERNVTYVNVLNAERNGDFQAYVENEDGKSWSSREDYEKSGGPQNEVYLKNGTDAIAFKVSKANAPVQISARAVGNSTANLVAGTGTNAKSIGIASNTEMYYEVTADENGIITITNSGDGMLALGNLKLPDGVKSAELTAADEEIVLAMLSAEPAPVEPEEPETPVFTPEKLNVSVKSIKVIRNKLVTVTVHASTDVEKLTINGQVVKPMNALLVKRGWSKEYIYVFTDTVKRNDSKDYEVVAYNAAGTASAGKTVTG